MDSAHVLMWTLTVLSMVGGGVAIVGLYLFIGYRRTSWNRGRVGQRLALGCGAVAGASGIAQLFVAGFPRGPWTLWIPLVLFLASASTLVWLTGQLRAVREGQRRAQGWTR
ncbi:hypothetical protein [Streptomyces sp. NPDC001250]|uniref:hypothetical protein n=1 Tax=unclassified Streptomyces TaxID=2593676 RepID=UPI00331C9C1E